MAILNPPTLSGPMQTNEAELLRENWALLAHAQAAATLLHETSGTKLIESICSSITSQYPYDVAWVGFAQNDVDKTIKVAGASGLAADYAKDIHVSWSEDTAFGKGPIGLCIRSGVAVIIEDTQTDPAFSSWAERAAKFGLRSCVAVPIPLEDGDLSGALTVYATIPNAFGEVELSLFKSLASDLGYGLVALKRKAALDNEIHERESAQEKLAASLRATIEAMSKTMEWRDPYTAGHQKRVAQISVAIAKKLGWDDERIKGLYMGAMVHDIGKVAVPAEILSKPSKLTELEMSLVREHVNVGYQILKDIPFNWPIAEMVYQHHERLDGSGYPRQLKGEDICEEARILAVADTFEAMASHRPYRPGKGIKATLDQIQVESGVSLDKKVVEALLELIQEKSFISESDHQLTIESE